MLPGNPVYPLPQGALSVHINGDHNHISICKSHTKTETGLNRQENIFFVTIPIPNIPDVAKSRQDLFKPSLYSMTIHSLLPH